jgi:hypothetical protein
MPKDCNGKGIHIAVLRSSSLCNPTQLVVRLINAGVVGGVWRRHADGDRGMREARVYGVLE